MLSHTVDPVHVHVCLVPGFPASAHSLLRIHFTSTSVVTRLATPSGQAFLPEREFNAKTPPCAILRNQPCGFHCIAAVHTVAAHHTMCRPLYVLSPFCNPSS